MAGGRGGMGGLGGRSSALILTLGTRCRPASRMSGARPPGRPGRKAPGLAGPPLAGVAGAPSAAEIEPRGCVSISCLPGRHSPFFFLSFLFPFLPKTDVGFIRGGESSTRRRGVFFVCVFQAGEGLPGPGPLTLRGPRLLQNRKGLPPEPARRPVAGKTGALPRKLRPFLARRLLGAVV